MWQSARTLRNPNSSNEERLFALLNISLAVVLEAAEPDEFLPISVPADDLVRKGVIGYARQLVKTRDLKSLPADLPDWMRHMARGIANVALALEGLNLKKNTNKVFGMLKGKQVGTIPDVIDDSKKIVGEVKDVAELRYDKQLQAQHDVAQEKGYDDVLYIRQNTTLLGDPFAMVDSGAIKRVPIDASIIK